MLIQIDSINKEKKRYLLIMFREPEVLENENGVSTPVFLKSGLFDETFLHKERNPIEDVEEMLEEYSDLIHWVYIPLWRFRTE
jgi:hypothetical protein